MSRNAAVVALFLATAALLLAGAWEAGAFVGGAGALVALMGPTDEQADARARNPQARRVR